MEEYVELSDNAKGVIRFPGQNTLTFIIEATTYSLAIMITMLVKVPSLEQLVKSSKCELSGFTGLYHSKNYI